jgi:hypothetical protein
MSLCSSKGSGQFNPSMWQWHEMWEGNLLVDIQEQARYVVETIT